MVDVLDFNDAIVDSKAFGTRHLLLGNGFSIAFSEIFNYPSLLEAAELSGQFFNTPHLLQVFETLDTKDFEQVIKSLDDTFKILPIYNNVISGADAMARAMERNAKDLKNILVRTITSTHPDKFDFNDAEFSQCKDFLYHFLGPTNEGGNIYTLNYDFLLYWATGEDGDYLGYDGFGYDKDSRCIIWGSENPQTVHYLHGALHLFDTELGLRKQRWERKYPLQQQVQDAMSSGNFPLFVAEGESKQKLEKIRGNEYLCSAYDNFKRRMKEPNDALFIFGHSLNENDKHILDCITKGTIPIVYLSLHGDVNSEKNKDIKALARGWETRRNSDYPLEVKFFKAETVRIWGQQISAHTELDDDIPF